MSERCRRCSAEVPPGTNRCPACRAFLAKRADWPEDPERCPSDVEERISKRTASLNFISLMLLITGAGLLTQIVPAFGPGALQRRVVGDLTLSDLAPPAGAILFVLGIGFGARAKGRSALWGLLALLGCLGVIGLHYLGKICHHCRDAAGHRERRCARCDAPL